MVQRLPAGWWHLVLDGDAYTVDLDNTPYTNLTALRSAAYREADIRNCVAATHKAGVKTLIIQAWGREDLPAQTMPHLTGVPTQPAPVVSLRNPPPPRPRTHVCDCGQGPITHPLTCSLWGNEGKPRIPGRVPSLAPAPQPAPRPVPAPAPAPRPPFVSARIAAPGEVAVWPAYGTWPPVPEGEEPRVFTSEEELETWEEEVEQLRLKAFAAAPSVDIDTLTPVDEEALLGPCTCGQEPTCLPECARAGG